MRGLGVCRRFPRGPLHYRFEEICALPIEPEAIVPVRTASVVLANYGLLFHDFPQLLGQTFKEQYSKYMCRQCIGARLPCINAVDKWLLDSCAYVSLQQATHGAVNSPIEHGSPVVRAFRPPRYGRALVLPIDGAEPGSAGFVDLKGVGVAPGVTPEHKPYSDGLEYLGVALADFFYGWLVDSVFARTVPGYSTVPVYAVIDLGFDIVNGWQGTSPAGLHVRRAHARNASEMPMSASEESLVQIHIELLLRTYGLTTASKSTSYEVLPGPDGPSLHYAGYPITCSSERHLKRCQEIASVVATGRIEMFNIQLMRGASWHPKRAQLFDFGHLHARREFMNHLGCPALDALQGVGQVIRREDKCFVQPDRRLAVDPNLFNRHAVNAFGFYVAEALRRGRVDRKEAEIIIRKAIVKALRKNGLDRQSTRLPWEAPCRPRVFGT